MIEERVVEEQVAPEPPPPPRNPWLWLAFLAIAVVAAAIVFIAVLADRGGDDEPTATETVAVAVPQTTVVVPALVGFDHADAGRAAEDVGLVANTYPVESDAPGGQIVAQDPEPGVRLDTSERLRLDVSIGSDPVVAVQVPDVAGIEGAQAREVLRRAGFTVLTVDEAAPSPDQAGQVLRQDPAAGTEAPALTQVTIYTGL